MSSRWQIVDDFQHRTDLLMHKLDLINDIEMIFDRSYIPCLKKGFSLRSICFALGLQTAEVGFLTLRHQYET